MKGPSRATQYDQQTVAARLTQAHADWAQHLLLMRRHPIVLSKNSTLSAATVTRLASCLLHLSIIVNRLPNEQFSFYVVQDAQPIRFLWHLKRIEERLRFHRCSVEIVSDYRNPIQSRVRLVNRPGAKKLDGEIHHETAHFFIPSVPRQREG
jgi:hypothetical protein